MPTFEVEMSGKAFEIEAPSLAAAQSALKGFTPPASREAGSAVDTATGLAKAAGTGLARGVADTAGLPGDAASLIGRGADWLAEKAGVPQRVRDAVSAAVRASGSNPMLLRLPPTSEATNETMQRAVGPYRKPETTPERYVENAARFVPGAVMGPGNVAKNAVAYGVIPGLASEAAGQAFEGSPAEPYARAAAGVAAGGAAALAQRPSSAGRLIAGATEGATPHQLERAEHYFQDAQRIGMPISRAEALQAVTGGATKIGELQHTVEGMGGMKPFYAQRPAQNEAAARRTFDTIAPPNAEPSMIGPNAGGAAENIVTRIRSAINQATRPMYDAAGQHLVTQQMHAANMADPLFAETLNAIRNDPARNAMVRSLSDRNVLMYNEIGKELQQRSQNAAQPLNPQANQQVASVTGRLGGDVKDMGVVSERASANGPSSLEAALATQARLRQQYLQPVLNGPIGKIAGQDTTTKSAVEALFPANPVPNSQAEIGQTMRALSRQRPGIANDLVRAHAEMTFNEATQRMASGGFNQSGGAKFAAVLRGNRQQAANLEASVRALPNGDQTWAGFNRLLDVMEAQQYRQATGSRTAFKIPGVEDLKSGGVANNVAQVVGGAGFQFPRKVANAIQNWNVGRNVDELANLLTSPEAAARFRQLASVPPTSAQFGALLARLTNIAREGSKSDGS